MCACSPDLWCLLIGKCLIAEQIEIEEREEKIKGPTAQADLVGLKWVVCMNLEENEAACDWRLLVLPGGLPLLHLRYLMSFPHSFKIASPEDIIGLYLTLLDSIYIYTLGFSNIILALACLQSVDIRTLPG